MATVQPNSHEVDTIIEAMEQSFRFFGGVVIGVGERWSGFAHYVKLNGDTPAETLNICTNRFLWEMRSILGYDMDLLTPDRGFTSEVRFSLQQFLNASKARDNEGRLFTEAELFLGFCNDYDGVVIKDRRETINDLPTLTAWDEDADKFENAFIERFGILPRY